MMGQKRQGHGPADRQFRLGWRGYAGGSEQRNSNFWRPEGEGETGSGGQAVNDFRLLDHILFITAYLFIRITTSYELTNSCWSHTKAINVCGYERTTLNEKFFNELRVDTFLIFQRTLTHTGNDGIVVRKNLYTLIKVPSLFYCVQRLLKTNEVVDAQRPIS